LRLFGDRRRRKARPTAGNISSRDAVVVVMVVPHADELTARDSAIGNGDHGFNVKGRFEA
jgi:hypothetical protein